MKIGVIKEKSILVEKCIILTLDMNSLLDIHLSFKQIHKSEIDYTPYGTTRVNASRRSNYTALSKKTKQLKMN